MGVNLINCCLLELLELVWWTKHRFYFVQLLSNCDLLLTSIVSIRKAVLALPIRKQANCPKNTKSILSSRDKQKIIHT